MFSPELSEAIRWFECNDHNTSTYNEKMGLILVDTIKDIYHKIEDYEMTISLLKRARDADRAAREAQQVALDTAKQHAEADRVALEAAHVRGDAAYNHAEVWLHKYENFLESAPTSSEFTSCYIDAVREFNHTEYPLGYGLEQHIGERMRKLVLARLGADGE